MKKVQKEIMNMAEIITMGELLVEIMRDQENAELYETGTFKGPFPSGAPAIFIDTAARLRKYGNHRRCRK